MGGLRVDEPAIKSKRQLERWVNIGVDYAAIASAKSQVGLGSFQAPAATDLHFVVRKGGESSVFEPFLRPMRNVAHLVLQ